MGAAALPSLCGVVAQHVGLYLVAPAIVTMAATLFVLHESVVQVTSRNPHSVEAQRIGTDKT